MALSELFQPFIEAKPVCVMARGILERLLEPQRLDALFARTAQRQYTRELLFSTAVELMAQVVLGRKPAVHAAYQDMRDRLGVSDTALYQKLQHMEPAVSAGLVCDSGRQAASLIRTLHATQGAWVKG